MLKLRKAEPEDAEALVKIYNPYITGTTVSYEYEALSAEEFRSRIEKISEGYPYIVAEENGKPVGYAYASSYRGRKAYSWDTEISIYLDMNEQGKGIGSLLMTKLLDILKKQNFVTAYSIIDYPNEGSMAIHEKFGFGKAGFFAHTAFKAGRWLDMIALEKKLNDFDAPPEIIRNWEQFF